MKILITGGSGFIGRHATQSLKMAGHHVTSTYFSAPGHGADKHLDLRNPEEIVALVNKTKPNVILHLAGNKNLIQCEKRSQEVEHLNFSSTKHLVDMALDFGFKLVFISSDYVFKGDRGNYTELEATSPATAYGELKAKSELYIREKNCRSAIVRTSAVYGSGATFFSWIIDALKKKQEVKAFTDSIFTPTAITDVSWALNHIIEQDLSGIFHVAGAPAISRFQMAQTVARHFEYDVSLVKPTQLTNEPGLPIARNSSLNSDSTSAQLQHKFLTLNQGLELIFPKG